MTKANHENQDKGIIHDQQKFGKLKIKIFQILDRFFQVNGQDASAFDIAIIADDPDVAKFLIQKKSFDFSAAIIGSLSKALQTKGAIEIDENIPASIGMLSADPLWSIVERYFWRKFYWKGFNDVYLKSIFSYYEIPLEIRRKILEHLEDNGIPKHMIKHHLISETIRGNLVETRIKTLTEILGLTPKS